MATESGSMHSILPPGSFFGETLDRYSLDGFTCVLSSYPEVTRIPPHAHENAFFYFVVDGVCEERYGARRRTSLPSTLVFHPAGQVHADRWGPPGGRCLHIEVAASKMDRLQGYGPLLDEPAEFPGGPASWLASRLFQELQRQDRASPLAMEGLALELLGEVSRRPLPRAEARPPRWLSRVNDLLRAGFAESPSLQEVADAVEVHPAHLARVFRRHYHCSIGDYIRQLRCEWACEQLRSSSMSLAEIALAAGFADQSHFCKTFKRLMGMTPGEFESHLRLRKPDTTK